MTRSTHQPTITGVQVRTGGCATFVRQIAGRQGAEAVVLIHGNISSSVFFEPLMLGLPGRFRPIALDLRGFGGSDPEPVDATRGVRDFAGDVLAVLDALELDRAHLVGWSLGGAVAMQVAIDAPGRISSLTLIAPISPYGFGGTVDASGTLLAPDAAGSGAGLVSRDLLAALVARDSSAENRSGARALLRRFYLAGSGRATEAPTVAEYDGVAEDDLVAGMLLTAVGPESYPGDTAPSPRWPGFAPGVTGVMNALSPRYCDLSALADIDPKPSILWIRGDGDRVISDASAMDAAMRGRAGRIANYPGVDSAPPQPMVTQTRAVLARYVEGGGVATEVEIAGAGHAPHLTALPMVLEALVPHLDGATRD
jgi:pimeloyl-ACP methyl ester carboxylesterase